MTNPCVIDDPRPPRRRDTDRPIPMHINDAPLTEKEREELFSGDPWRVQEGGDHYKKYAIQPLEYALRNKLGIIEHAVVKYVTRYKDKGGRDDLLKARHYIDLLIQEEYPNG